MDKTAVGKMGENVAGAFLSSNGYNIIEKNFKRFCGEIDIIAQKDETIVFVEVKFKKNASEVYPREAVDKRKQKRVRDAASMFISMKSDIDKNILSMDFRFDVIEIIGFNIEDITHIENAF